MRKITEFRQGGSPIVYTDEIYNHCTHTKPQSLGLTRPTTNLELKKPISKGPRLKVVHAG